MDKTSKFISKIKRPLAIGLLIFLLGGFGGIFVQKYLAPYLSTKPVFRHIGFLRTDGPIVITRTEQVRVNEGVKLIDLVKQLTPKVVTVIGGRGEFGTNFQETVRASGVIITSDGMVATDKQVFEDTRNRYWAVTTDGKIYPVNVLAFDPRSPLALAKIDDGTLSAANFGNSFELESAQAVVMLSGTESANLAAVKTSHVSQAPGNANLNQVFNSQAYRPAFSLEREPAVGEGVFNLNGQLVGIGTEGGSVIPVETIKAAQDSYFANQKIIRPALGLSYSLVTPAGSQILGLPETSGLLVRSVLRNSPAAASGLQVGDVVTRINNEEVTAKQGLDVFINRAKPGDEWTVRFLSDGEEQEVKIKLGQLG